MKSKKIIIGKHCERCGDNLDGEIHASGYDSDGPSTPFFCSEKCYGNGVKQK